MGGVTVLFMHIVGGMFANLIVLLLPLLLFLITVLSSLDVPLKCGKCASQSFGKFPSDAIDHREVLLNRDVLDLI